MTYHQEIDLAGVFDPIADLNLARVFLHDHGTALAKAAFLLGGGAASARVFQLATDLRETRRLTRRQRRQLAELHRLLTLEDVADPERVEAGRFAAIDPSARVVDDICRLADKLGNLLARISAEAAPGETHLDAERVFRQVA